MLAKFQLASFISKPFSGIHLSSRAASKLLWLLALVLIVALGVWVNHALAAAASTPTTASAMEPAVKLATGTLSLEGTGDAVDAVSAARLLPLWELLEQLDTSGSAAPQEITAVVEEIQLNMTAAQIKVIDAMKIEQSQPAAAPAAAVSSTKSSTQVASSVGDPMMGGDMPMDSGGPTSLGGSQSTTSGSKTSSATGSSAAIKQVIELLKSKVKS